MFDRLRLFGRAGTVLYGYRPALEVSSWRIVQDAKTKQWILHGTPTRLDAFLVRQRPLLFTAPRPETRDGFWSWGVEKIIHAEPGRVIAWLGPPER